MKLIGIVLIVVGLFAFAFGGFSYLKQSRVIDAGPLQVSWRGNVPVPPIIVIGAVIGVGVVMVGMSRRRHA